MRARTVSDVVLGEAVSGTPEQRFRDMVAIASAIQNRANALGVSPQDVVANRHEFNAFDHALPPGVENYRSLADQALGYVEQNGPVHKGMFYATPGAARNLPSGLQMVGATTGHQYYSDPRNRAIGTAVGFRKPSMEAQQQLSALANKTIPTPVQKPDLSFQAAPVAPVERQALATQAAPMDNVGLLGRTSRFADPMQGLRAGLLAQAQAMQEQKAAEARQQGYAAAVPGLAAALSATNHPANTLDGIPAQKPGPYDAIGYNFGPQAAPAMAAPKTYVDPQVVKVDQPVTPAATAYSPTTDNTATGAIASQGPAMGLPASGPTYDAAGAKAAAKATLDHKMHGLLGTLGAAALGGLVAGPVGALVGGLLGRHAVNGADKFPSKPDKPDRGLLDGTSHAAMANSPGNRDAVSRSSQAQSVSKSGAVGLF